MYYITGNRGGCDLAIHRGDTTGYTDTPGRRSRKCQAVTVPSVRVIVGNVPEKLPEVIPSVKNGPDPRDGRKRDAARSQMQKISAGKFHLNLPSRHSMTSSARASSVGGISRPSAFAVLRLITSLPAWIAHYNEVHPHKALGYRSPREFIAAHARP